MKQHITSKQADEISKYKFYTLFPDLVIRDDWSKFHHKKITIGKMIELLMDRGYCYTIDYGKLEVWILGNITTKKTYCPEVKLDNLLCDALWEAVKYTLKA